MILGKTRLAFFVAATCLPVAAASAMPLGSDADACESGRGPAIQATISGLKDRSGRLKLELYPANEADFLKDDRDLVREGKFFRRVWAATPTRDAVVLCIKVPAPGRYALLFTHDRDGSSTSGAMAQGSPATSNSVAAGRNSPRLRSTSAAAS